MPRFGKPFRRIADFSAVKGGRKSALDFEERHLLCYALRLVEHAGSLVSEDFCKLALSPCPSQVLFRMRREALAYAKQHAIKARRGHELDVDPSYDLPEAMLELYRLPRLRTFLYRQVLSYLRGRVAALPKGPDSCRMAQRLAEAARTFKLNDVETDLLLLGYLYQRDRRAEQICDQLAELCGNRALDNNPLQWRRVCAVLTGHAPAKVTAALSEQGRLLKCGIIGEDLAIAPEIGQFLSGQSNRALASNYYTEFTGTAIPLSEHTVEKAHVETLERLIAGRQGAGRAGLNILFYGPPGTGKTEFARSLGAHLGLAVFEVGNMDNAGEKRNAIEFRQRALTACRNRVDPSRAMIVVDEADSMINSVPAFLSFAPVAEKGQANRLLDENETLTVWITNRYDGIDESTCRRFDYSLEFEKLSFDQRCAVWRAGMRKHRLGRLFSDEQLQRFAAEYEVSAGGVDVALRNAARLACDKADPAQVHDLVERLLKAHLKIVDQDRTVRNESHSFGRNYSLDGLNVHANLGDVMTTLAGFNTYWETMAEEPEVRNLNVLLYGPPGSGKTEFARYVARTLKRRLVLRRASDLMSMWVGMSEKLIRQAFREAERDKAILFIDEADSLLGAREGASHSWEITQVNEMLTNMEHFKGMLICATNFRKVVDSAAIRRFSVKLEFDFLTPEGSRVFYERFFGDMVNAPLDPSQVTVLAGIPSLAPGDFKAVYQRHAFMPAGKVTHQMLLEALRQEVRARDEKAGRGIGFGK